MLVRILLIVLSALPFAASAQTGAGSIQGTVKDPSGAVVPGAKVEAHHTLTGNRFQTESNAVGFFLLPFLQPGAYRLEVEAPGMEKWSGELTLSTGQQASVGVALKVAATATEVTVAGDITPLVTTTSPTLANVLERARVEQLPLNGRFLQSLVQMTTPGLEGLAESPRVFGLRDGAMEFLQDGAVLNDRNVGRLMARPPGLDTVREFRVETSVPSAKFSRPANTILSTRSGTNKFHGALFHTGRNNGFGVARQRQDFYTKPPQLIRNEYGASLGGPVRVPRLYNGLNRTFFFAAWEAFNLRDADTGSTALPTAEMRNGDFSALRDAIGRQIVLYDPWTTSGPTWRRQPYAGNVIPASLRSPLAAYVYSVTPLPTLPHVDPLLANNYFAPDPRKQDHRTFTVRADHRLGDRDQVYGRYSHGYRILTDRRAFNTGGNPVTSDGNWNLQSVPEWTDTAMVSWTHVFSPSFFMETIGTGSVIDWQYSLNLPSARENIAARLGTPNPFGINGAPQLLNVGFGSVQYHGVVPRRQETRIVSGEQALTWVKNKHQVQFGWRYRHEMLDTLPDRPFQGNIDFNSFATALYDPATGEAMGATPRTGHVAANFFLGIAASYGQTRPPGVYNMRSRDASGFLQDTWKVSRRLTLNLGLRYEYLPPFLDANGVSSVFDMRTRRIVRSVSVADLIRTGYTTQPIVDAYRAVGVEFATTKEAGLPAGLIPTSKRDFSPRLGFAYQLSGGARTVVVRGGYGAYRFPLPARTFNNQRVNPPLQGTYSRNWNAANQSPDGRPNYLLRSAPTIIAGRNSADVLDASRPPVIPRGVSITTLASELPTSMAHQWNLTLEAEVMRATVVRAGLTGTAGRNLEQYRLINGQPNNYIWFTLTGEPLPTGEYAAVARRIFDQKVYTDILIFSKIGFSNFNGFQVEFNRPFNRGLAAQFFYVMSNAFSTGAVPSEGGGLTDNAVPEPAVFLPGALPENLHERIRFYNYARDTGVPKHRVRWNFLYELPVGKGRRLLGGASPWLNRLAGGWQVAASGSLRSRYWDLPTGNWGRLGEIEIYGTRYPIEDCRSGECIRGYLYYNGYIPANRINSRDAQGRPNGVMGVPSNYTPAHQPIHPTPADGGSPADPNFALYGTNNVTVRLKDGSLQRVAFDTGLHPWRNQVRRGPWISSMDASLFKQVPITERLRLRLNMDFFNVLNQPGLTMPNSSTGILSLRNSAQPARELQWTIRLVW